MVIEELKTEKIDWRWKNNVARIEEAAKECNLVVTNIWAEPHRGMWVKTHYTVLGSRQAIANLQRKIS